MRVRVRKRGRVPAMAAVVAVALATTLAACADVTPKDPHRLTQGAADLGRTHLAVANGLDTIEEVAAAAPGEVMELEVEDDGAFRLVSRFTVSEDQVDGSTRTWRACWRYRISAAGGVYEGPDAVDCPDGDPLTFDPPPTTVPVDLGEDPEAVARAAFGALDADDWADLDAVHELAASIFDSTPTPPIDVRRDGDVTGIAIGEPGECLLVRSEPFDVWLPGSIYRSFRDEACVASWATAGALRRAPH